MDFDQYVAARYGRLVEHALDLGCAESEACVHVDQVLAEQRRRIRRAEDPDPLVREALERAVRGTPERSRRTAPLVALGVVAVAVAVGVVATYRPAPHELPSLFALTGAQAEELLESEGYEVTLEEARSCEPPGLVIDSDPPSGGPVREGATVTVRTSVIAGSHCEPAFPRRSAAWEFVLFALGRGPAPALADELDVVVDGGPPRHLDGDVAAGLQGQVDLTLAIERAAEQTRAGESGLPRLSVVFTAPPATWCGIDLPPIVADRSAIRFEIDPRPEDRRGCPLTVDLYRTDSAIDAVIVYTPQGR
ncbi:PASTA domain-containing protein [Nocardioides halotolerans]|uniref:PASTA domain-containing protein n=1 Tax=Nocardioides halotolerans TaxID=433660 RepID=UPI0004061C3B|nr:PASTA domain-containing protein [Nocardioides halotolerans]